jgi:ubiquinone/menaquinone biosynthesis C-methylase UbiE
MQPKMPNDIDWQEWVSRWDLMQQRYLPNRAERFEIIGNLIRDTQKKISGILDLGCGTGSLALEILEKFPDANVIGIDFDPTLLPLAQKRLDKFKDRTSLLLEDLRKPQWSSTINKPFDAVISATALHWLTPDELETLYLIIAKILRPGGIFLNADHVGNENNTIQQSWIDHKDKILSESANQQGETWEEFWQSYMKAVGSDAYEIHQRVLNGWTGGIEQGMPLTWHFEKLKSAGFKNIDCFWRCDCDAIYGGIRK